MLHIVRDIRREAHNTFEAFEPELPAGSREYRGWRRFWAFARAMFFRLTPARRAILLLALVLVCGSTVVIGEGPPREHDQSLLAAACLLFLLALELADRVALKRDLEVAREIQAWLLPHVPPQFAHLDIAFSTRPANTVAGDYYDVFSWQPRGGAGSAVLLVVADVAGKGIPAGLLMAGFRSCLHTLADTSCDLREVVQGLHRFCCEDSNQGRRFTSAFLAGYDEASRKMVYVNAGQNPPLLRRAGGAIVQLEATGVPFGMLPSAKYEIGQIPVAPGDLLLIYTDGVVEAENDRSEEYGLPRLCNFVRGIRGGSEDVRRSLLESIDGFTDRAPQHDDITCMVIQFLG